MTKQELWRQAKVYDGQSVEELIEKTYRLTKVIDCPGSQVYIEEASDIRNGLCKFKYEIWNYDISPDKLYFESDITLMELFDFISDNDLAPLGVYTYDYIFDNTKEALKLYILSTRK